jgi:hypothetical protein
MNAWFGYFRDGGWGMFPTLFFGVLLLAAAGRYAVSPQRRWVPLLVALTVLTLASGALGFTSGMITTAYAVTRDHVPDPGIISLEGFGESLNNVRCALMFVVLAALGATVGAWRVARGSESTAA